MAEERREDELDAAEARERPEEDVAGCVVCGRPLECGKDGVEVRWQDGEGTTTGDAGRGTSTTTPGPTPTPPGLERCPVCGRWQAERLPSGVLRCAACRAMTLRDWDGSPLTRYKAEAEDDAASGEK